MMRWLLVFLALLAVPTEGRAADSPSPEAAATIIVFNAKNPASEEIAKYYAGRRGIPEDHLVGLNCSDAEEIAREDFLVDIEAPLRARFTKSGWWKIDRNENGQRVVTSASVRFVAIMRGVPMKIRAKPVPPPPEGSPPPPPKSPAEILFQHDEASVDSEISALFALGHDLGGPIGNPYYRRFSSVLEVPPAASPLLVCRLDGPSDVIVHRMIDDSIAAEKNGLWGWAYLDGRGITSGPYAIGDEWITAAGAILLKQGIPVIADAAPETLPDGFPVTDAAIYYGWYTDSVTGPFLNPAMHFVPGAIAVHLHSYSAATIRSPRANWAAPLLARGAAATMGNVYEPFLEFTIQFDILQDRLMSGLTLAESAYAATRALSWMGVVLGDPLYRPYASWFSLSSDHGGASPWEKYRDIVVAAGGNPIAAKDALHKLAATLDDAMPIEALGQAQAAAGDFPAALETLAEAGKLARKPDAQFRIILEEVDILRRADRKAEAKKKIAAALGTFRTDAQQLTLGKILLAIEPPPPPPEKPAPKKP